MRVLVALLCAALRVTPVYGFFEGTCLKEEPAPGVLVVAPGSRLSLTCDGQVVLDGAEVAVPSETPTASGAGHTTQSAVNIVTEVNGQQTHAGSSRKRRDSTLRRASPEHKATPTATALRPTRGVGVGLAESDWPTVGDLKSEANYGGREEGARVRRPQWRLNGRTLSFGEGVFERNEGAAVSISSVSAGHSGRYSCHHSGRALSSVKVIVAAPPERPILTCYKRSPSSKIRCEWTPQQPLVVQPHCYLYHNKGTSDSFSRLNCSFSVRLGRCWCTLEHSEEEKRHLYKAYLCVTSIVGNATSILFSFTPMGIIKPEPPSAVAVRAVEGHQRTLRVTWGFPCSWKRHDQYYELVYEISYRPASSPGSQALQSGIINSQHYTMTDVLPRVEYAIQLRASDEYDGQWSDWSAPVYAFSWTAPPVPLWDTDLSTTVDPVYIETEGSGIDYNPTFELEQSQDQVWHHVLWISGLCVLSFALAVYAFRHREKFVSKLCSLHLVTVHTTVPHPQSTTTTTASTPQPQEAQALVTFTPTHYKHPLPNEVEEEDGEEKPEKRSEAISFNNTSYFLLQRPSERSAAWAKMSVK